jgi:hypothetical protein
MIVTLLVGKGASPMRRITFCRNKGKVDHADRTALRPTGSLRESVGEIASGAIQVIGKGAEGWGESHAP